MLGKGLADLGSIVAHFDELSVGRDRHIAASPTVGYEQRMRHRFVRECVELARPTRVLDVGCGNGRDAIPIASMRPETAVLGVDISPGMIAEARSCLVGHEEGVRRRVRFDVADLSLPGAVEDGTFDLVVCSEVLEHVPEWPAMMENLRRALAPGGHAVVTLPNRASLYGANRWLIERRNARRGLRPWPHPYDAWKRPREVLGVAREVGFEPVLERGACYLPGFTLFAKLPAAAEPVIRAVAASEPVLRRLVPRAAYMYCVLLRRKAGAA